jgi:hypothetical protein
MMWRLLKWYLKLTSPTRTHSCGNVGFSLRAGNEQQVWQSVGRVIRVDTDAEMVFEKASAVLFTQI